MSESWAEVPPVSFDEDLVRILKTSKRNIQQLRRAGCFPIPELPKLDKRHRYGRADVIAYLERKHQPWPARRRA